MASSTTNFISITQAAADYPTSRRTIERRRGKARDASDKETLDAFMIRTKDGSEYHAPSEELAQQLSKDGKKPETYVSREWLDKTFGQQPRHTTDSARHNDATPRQVRRHDGGGVTHPDAATDDPIVNALLGQLEKKDEQLQTQSELIKALTERQRESNVLLSEFQRRLPQTTQSETIIVDAEPDPQPSNPKSRTQPSKKTNRVPKKPPTKKPNSSRKTGSTTTSKVQRSWFATRFLRGRKNS